MRKRNLNTWLFNRICHPISQQLPELPSPSLSHQDTGHTGCHSTCAGGGCHWICAIIVKVLGHLLWGSFRSSQKERGLEGFTRASAWGHSVHYPAPFQERLPIQPPEEPTNTCPSHHAFGISESFYPEKVFLPLVRAEVVQIMKQVCSVKSMDSMVLVHLLGYKIAAVKTVPWAHAYSWVFQWTRLPFQRLIAL